MLQRQSSWRTMANPRDKRRVLPSMLLFRSHFQHKNRFDQHSAVECRTMAMHEPSLRTASRKRPSRRRYPRCDKSRHPFCTKTPPLRQRRSTFLRRLHTQNARANGSIHAGAAERSLLRTCMAAPSWGHAEPTHIGRFTGSYSRKSKPSPHGRFAGTYRRASLAKAQSRPLRATSRRAPT